MLRNGTPCVVSRDDKAGVGGPRRSLFLSHDTRVSTKQVSIGFKEGPTFPRLECYGSLSMDQGHGCRTERNTISLEEGRGHRVRLAGPRDYGEIADVHCRAFYGHVSSFWDTLLRLDRILALDQGETMSRKGYGGRFGCLVCSSSSRGHPAATGTTTRVTAVSSCDHTRGRESFRSSRTPSWVLSWMLQRIMAKSNDDGDGKSGGSDDNNGNDQEDILGAVCIDTNMTYIPTRRFTWPALFNGAVYNIGPRKTMAYISNLAVCPSQRRSGIGTTLVLAAERLAANQWDVAYSTLHVDPTNTAAYELYTQLGYRYVGRQDFWTAFVEGRRQDKRLVLMVKKLQKH